MALFYCKKYPRIGLRLNDIKKKVQFEDHFFITYDSDIIESMTKNNNPNIELLSSKEPKNVKNILLHRMGGVGDILFLTPIAKYFKEQGKIVSFYCHFGCFEVLLNNPYVDKIYINADIQKYQLPKGFGKPIIDIDDVPNETVTVEKMTPEIYLNFDKVYTFKNVIEANPEAELNHAVDACFSWIGINPSDKDKKLVLNVTEAEIAWGKEYLKEKGFYNGKKNISISPSASAVLRSWPSDYLNTLLLDLKDEYNMFYLDRGMGFTLRQAISLIYLMDLVITVDTGILHIAGAFDKKIIALFGAFDAKLRCGYFKNCNVIQLTEQVCPKPCFSHRDYCKVIKKDLTHPPCMKKITVDIVKEKIREIC